jgi:hypothetical protein
LIKRDGTKIVVPLSYETVTREIKQSESLQVGKEHSIRCKAINEWYGYNSTDELDIYVLQNFKNKYNEIMEIIQQRKKANLTISKEVIANIAKDL